MARGFAYAAIILDAWSRRVVGYAMNQSIDALLTVLALKAAIAERHPPPGCIHHSDNQGGAICGRDLSHDPGCG
jgi:putative transposase